MRKCVFLGDGPGKAFFRSQKIFRSLIKTIFFRFLLALSCPLCYIVMTIAVRRTPDRAGPRTGFRPGTLFRTAVRHSDGTK